MKVCKNCGSPVMHVGHIGVQFECGSLCYGHTPEKVSNITASCKTKASLIDEAFKAGFDRGYSAHFDDCKEPTLQ